jgi:hypothetical protein
MTDVLKTPEKKRFRRALIAGALAALERDGWKISREKGGVKGRVRQITRNGKTLLAAIRTSQDGWIAFPRNAYPKNGRDTKWVTLSDVDVVVAAAINPEQPHVGLVHIFEAKELLERFDRAYAARRKEGHSIPVGRGVWVSLYHPESDDPVNRVGGGIGLLRKAFATIALDEEDDGDEEAAAAGPQPPRTPPASAAAGSEDDDGFEPLTIAQAKTRLARTLGVDPSNIKITVEA